VDPRALQRNLIQLFKYLERTDPASTATPK